MSAPPGLDAIKNGGYSFARIRVSHWNFRKRTEIALRFSQTASGLIARRQKDCGDRG
jgi:hypothetical protein